MSLLQFMSAWPIIAWATFVVFLAGGMWFTLWQLKREFQSIKPILEKIPSLEERVNTNLGEISRLRDDMQEVAIKAEKALLLQGGMNMHAGD